MPDGSGSTLTSRDRGLVWHPYAPLDGPEPYAVRSASGVTLELSASDGEQFTATDAMASWWCAIHGYRHPELDAAAHAQIDRFSHVMFGGLTHEPAVALAERLTAIAPGPMAHVFFADSGSVSVEVALKLALQFQAAVGRPERQRFLTVRGGYHGDTFAAMSVCDPVDGMHSAFPGVLARQVFAPRPPAARLRMTETGEEHWESDDLAFSAWTTEVEALADRHHDELAAVVVEPVLQGAGGMHVYDPRCLRVLREVADDHGLLLVVDEIATGFGRTGRLFASEWADVAPDIMCVGKALTGGYLTLAAVLATARVGDAITSSSYRALLHGPTFMANPLACAVANASLELVEAGWKDEVPRIARLLDEHLAPARSLSQVRDVRTLGAVGVVQLAGPVDVPRVTRAALRRGVWVRPFRDLVYTMPPYVCTDDDVHRIAAGIVGAVEEVHG
ncbi:adenosylmethionine-8-amino-7-oxononanoate aminotransferase [Humibacillus xanthopallidus]|uniref:Adenosylmethionine-8-amino-7-oxononanoate aminotransferase n=1 Tax=Humibacillus xanthopallidus TaxID=412689 RepID=A0A543PSP6_9MICO|nr:adenosylmethionine--8-amino-7-oxononanoate transaminase [Humibacillus xanthopallidus]TQN47097.1 adenosylmethionine-8-amino-7-oxononanoate aminotransferase [Humibacillus xanthopallidus]